MTDTPRTPPSHTINLFDPDRTVYERVRTGSGIVAMCTDCGAAVVDEALHDVFHRRLQLMTWLNR